MRPEPAERIWPLILRHPFVIRLEIVRNHSALIIAARYKYADFAFTSGNTRRNDGRSFILRAVAKLGDAVSSLACKMEPVIIER